MGVTGDVFVADELPVPVALQRARRGLEAALADGGLVEESRRALADGLVYVMPVGPRSGHFPSRDVVVRVLPSRQHGDQIVVALRWEAAGTAGRLFPTLDANLTLSDAGDEGSLLSIVARYQPPLGPVGALVDRAALSRVAQATMHAFLAQICDRVCRLAEIEGQLPG